MFLKDSKKANEKYYGPYWDPILSAVKQKINACFQSVKVPSSQRLFALHVLFRAKALRYFKTQVQQAATNTVDTITIMKEFLIAPCQRDSYTTEYNILLFRDIMHENSKKKKGFTYSRFVVSLSL